MNKLQPQAANCLQASDTHLQAEEVQTTGIWTTSHSNNTQDFTASTSFASQASSVAAPTI